MLIALKNDEQLFEELKEALRINLINGNSDYKKEIDALVDVC